MKTRSVRISKIVGEEAKLWTLSVRLQRLVILYASSHNNIHGLLEAAEKMQNYYYYTANELVDLMELCGFPEVAKGWVFSTWRFVKPERDADQIEVRMYQVGTKPTRKVV
jgi:hypothetical protein